MCVCVLLTATHISQLPAQGGRGGKKKQPHFLWLVIIRIPSKLPKWWGETAKKQMKDSRHVGHL
jgi:hypothetical protein